MTIIYTTEPTSTTRVRVCSCLTPLTRVARTAMPTLNLRWLVVATPGTQDLLKVPMKTSSTLRVPTSAVSLEAVYSRPQICPSEGEATTLLWMTPSAWESAMTPVAGTVLAKKCLRIRMMSNCPSTQPSSSKDYLLSPICINVSHLSLKTVWQPGKLNSWQADTLLF